MKFISNPFMCYILYIYNMYIILLRTFLNYATTKRCGGDSEAVAVIVITISSNGITTSRCHVFYNNSRHLVRYSSVQNLLPIRVNCCQ